MHTAGADTTQLTSWVASAMCTELPTVGDLLTTKLRHVGGVNAPVGSRDPVYNSAAIAYGCRIVNWVSAADGCVHTADTTQLGRINSQHVQFQIFNQIGQQSSWARLWIQHTVWRVKTSTQLNSTVASCRRCVLGLRLQLVWFCDSSYFWHRWLGNRKGIWSVISPAAANP